MKRIYRITAFLLIVALLFLLGSCSDRGRLAAPQDGEVQIAFLDVGQADCAVIRTKNAVIVIDTGCERSAGNELLSYLGRLGIEKIDLLILTHPHEDHIGGAAALLGAYRVERCLMPELLEDTTAFRGCLDALEAEACTVTRAVSGVLCEYDGMLVEVLSPTKEFYSSLNDAGAVIRIGYGEHSFLFMADASGNVEAELLEAYSADVLRADILKVAHHGSASSTSAAFLFAVMPQYAVISCAADNEYGFPHADVLSRLAAVEATVYRTDTAGTVMFSAKDGTVSVIEED